MKKIWIVILMIAVLGIGSTGCSLLSNNSNQKDISSEDKNLKDNESDTDTEYQSFEADVIESGDRLLVYPDEDSMEYTSSDKISVGLSQIQDIPELKPGDRIKINYGGGIAESYPAQISAGKIELIGHNYVIDGFFALIDDIYNEDTGLNSNITMIAIDTSNLDMLSKAETEILLAMVRNEYNLEVIQGTYEELAEQGLIDKDNLYFKDGVLIEFSNVEINNSRKKITCSIQKWRSGLGAIGWDAKAKLDGDIWNVSRDKMWIS